MTLLAGTVAAGSKCSGEDLRPRVGSGTNVLALGRAVLPGGGLKQWYSSGPKRVFSLDDAACSVVVGET